MFSLNCNSKVTATEEGKIRSQWHGVDRVIRLAREGIKGSVKPVWILKIQQSTIRRRTSKFFTFASYSEYVLAIMVKVMPLLPVIVAHVVVASV